ncbi:hypothetical protein CWB89_00230 [Pseudoalteromonas piscicida]|uniref:DUF1737 domain-containing protein n=1 Tax=Pseudoalteromonas piscicida TaxID=43662 RepID=A0AAQ2IRZ2_PSEO7|nr:MULTISPECIES: DUF1737 domain-containing protein [Pseudoalteromonas]MDP4486445.1 DUF1737 domain-containing protein [Pseudoalteromonas piscicida]TMN40702.1 hypothetical protein CWB94_09250 [Pseudoalteromonas piscicida]TMN43751.1 hypothetical protein CWB95_04805 [Pseudoalteromonas piscicida]TMN50803.1 hypothetical protein CWB91_13935 [Pseudoalteromonas piscicida]TMN57089.1 hypothetical protein CWB92_00760 [Pseudoalteromonas piscicida]
MEYTLVKTATYKGLIKEVNELIKQGWIPQGGVMEDQNGRCLQAMIKT